MKRNVVFGWFRWKGSSESCNEWRSCCDHSASVATYESVHSITQKNKSEERNVWKHDIIFHNCLHSVRPLTSHAQLLPPKDAIFYDRNAAVPSRVSAFLCLMSVRSSAPPLPSPDLHYLCWWSSLLHPVSRMRSCMFVTEVPPSSLCYVCFFPFRCLLRCSSARANGRDSRGQRWMYHSRVSSGSSWTGFSVVPSWPAGRRERACRWWGDCTYYNMLASRGGQIWYHKELSGFNHWSRGIDLQNCDFRIWKPLLAKKTHKKNMVCVKKRNKNTCPWYDLFW